MAEPYFSQDQISHFINLAVGFSKQTKCQRPLIGGFGVGCVITNGEYEILSWGTNGNPSPLIPKCDSDVPGQCGCIHAEEMAAIRCDAHYHVEKIVFCSHLPCKMCAKRLILLGGVTKVYYKYDYRIKDSLEIFKQVGIQATQVDE